MTLPNDWWITDLENEPCDGCGVKPSKHAGHGSFTCKDCYEGWWCPKCHYDCRHQPHVCPTAEQIAEYKKQLQKDRELYKELGIDIE